VDKTWAGFLSAALSYVKASELDERDNYYITDAEKRQATERKWGAISPPNGGATDAS
jgi:hypothetical protein